MGTNWRCFGLRRVLPVLGLALAGNFACGSSEVDPDDAGSSPGRDSQVDGPGDTGSGDAGVQGPDGGGDAGPDPAACRDHRFELSAPAASAVQVTGSWLGWPGPDAALPLENDGGTWSIVTRIDEGENAYKFLVDGAYVTDPNAPDYEDDGFGGQNGVVVTCGRSRPVEVCGDPSRFDWRDVVMYFALIDRFRDSDGVSVPVEGATGGDAYRGPSAQFEGGDLNGVTERLPYLTDLGVTALWLSAPFSSRQIPGASVNFLDPNLYSGYHGYWPSPGPIDFTDREGPRPTVERRIGTAQDLAGLIEAAHGSTSAVGGHGVKVLTDYVMNHVDLESGLYRAHPEWFARNEAGEFRLCGPDNLWDDPVWGTRCAFTEYLPPFDFDRPEPRSWSISDARWWVERFGFDGYRLDAIKHVPDVWLTELRQQLDQAVPNPAGGRFYLVGETFSYSRNQLASFVDPVTRLDGQFDFPMRDQLCRALFTGEESMSGLARWMAENDGYYGERAVMTTWIGNHDIPRPIHFANGQLGNCREASTPRNGWQIGRWVQPETPEPYERLALAFAAMFTGPGVPLIYYGDEIGLAGGGDPDNRRRMPWPDEPAAPTPNVHQETLRSKVRALARLRGEKPVLSRGRRSTVSSTDDTWVYRMRGCLGERPIVVALNRADQAASVTLPEGTYDDLLDPGAAAGSPLEVPARGYRVLERR